MIQESDEIIAIVDQNDEQIGQNTRQFVRINNLIHRCTFIYVFNIQKQIFVFQRRSSLKQYCPNFIDLCFGGVVQNNESYDQNAIRETQEEIGINSEISNVKFKNLNFLFKFYHESNFAKFFGNVYILYTDQLEFKKQDEEIEEIFLVKKQDVQLFIQNQIVTPDSLQAFNIIEDKFQTYF